MKLYNIKLIYLFIALACVALLTNVVLQVYYYFNFDVITKKKADEYFSSIVEQVQGRMESTQQEIRSKSNEIAYSRLLQQYLNTQDKSKKAEYFPFLVDYISNVIHSTDYMKGIRIVENAERYIGATTEDEYTAITSDIFRKIGIDELLASDQSLKKPGLIGPFLVQNGHPYYYAYVEPIFKTMPGDFSFDPIALGVFICSAGNLQSLIDSILIPERSVLVFSFNDTIVSANQPAFVGESLSGKFQSELDQVLRNERQENKLVKLTEIGEGQWKILLSIPIADITTDTAELKNRGLIISIAEIVFFSIAGFLLIRVIYTQISHLLSDISLVSRKDAGYRLKVRGTNEIGVISRYVNAMLGKIEEANETLLMTRERLYVTELEKKQSEVNALHSQINPHFLYNTLECVRSIAKYRNVNEIVKISTAMAHIFRYSIKAEEFVAIRDELDIVQSYFSIMNIRFQERFRFVLNVDEKLLDCRMLKMILQPIVENAFYHGLEQMYGQGAVTLTITAEAGRIALIVKDDGAGIAPGKLRQLTEALAQRNNSISLQERNRSIGLVNIANRIALVYGPSYGISIDSEPDKGTRVRIEIPDERQRDEEVCHD